MSCSGTNTVLGGRRRTRGRKMRGGNGYGVGQPIAVGALEYVPNMTSVPDGAAYKPTGGRRRRRSRRRGGRMDGVGPGDFVTGDGQLLVSQNESGGNNEWRPVDEAFRVLEGSDPSRPGLYRIDYANPVRPAMNDNQEPLGLLPNAPRVVAPSAPRAEGGRRRRRGGTQEATAPLDPDMVTKSQCPEPNTFSPSIKNAAGVMLGYCRAPGEWQIATKLNKHKGGRRSRRKSKGRRRRSMRGGGSVAGVGYGFDGSGARGLANANPYPSNLPPSGAFAIPGGTR